MDIDLDLEPDLNRAPNSGSHSNCDSDSDLAARLDWIGFDEIGLGRDGSDRSGLNGIAVGSASQQQIGRLD